MRVIYDIIVVCIILSAIGFVVSMGIDVSKSDSIFEAGCRIIITALALYGCFFVVKKLIKRSQG